MPGTAPLPRKEMMACLPVGFTDTAARTFTCRPHCLSLTTVPVMWYGAPWTYPGMVPLQTIGSPSSGANVPITNPVSPFWKRVDVKHPSMSNGSPCL